MTLLTLSEKHKKEIFAILAAGGSREAAAKAAGLTSTQLHNLILADEAFAESVRSAEHQAELFFINQIREATKSASGWRAAAWWLERRRAAVFGITKNDVLSPETVENVLRKFFEIVFLHVKDEETRQKILADAEKLFSELHS